MDELDTRLAAAVKRRDSAAAECRRLEGRLEAAKAAKEAVEAECRAKGVDPDKIDSAIQKLETKYKSLVDQLEIDVAAAEQALKPFLKETD
jgi:chromosome segregation ATPase